MTLAASAQRHLPQVDKYDLLEEIGHGGMATVYRARDPRLSRDVAVKVIHRHLRESKEVARRFGDEARAVAKLRHDNIVEIFDVADDTAPERYLVAELVRGASLRKVLQDCDSLPAEVAAAVAISVADGLAHAHERGVVHRDVKPENVLFALPSQGADSAHVIVKITDFGIAKMLDQQGVTATGQVLGSPAYMAPEQIECGDVDARSDVFSLGVLLYETMVGHLPFEGKNPAQVLRRVLDGDFAPADQEQPTVGAGFAAIAAKALAQKQLDRYPDMTSLATALRAELAALGIDDSQTALDDYFKDPVEYQRALTERLVPRLLERGKAAHAVGDVVAAAGHFNRALAFAPHDAAALALVSGLSRRKARRTLVYRAGLALGIAAVTLGGTVATVKLWKKRPIVVPIVIQPDASATASAPAVPVVSAPTNAGPPRTMDRPPPLVRTFAAPPASGHATPSAPDRPVRFLSNVPGARVSIDGGGAGEIQGVVKTLAVGSHRYSADAPDGTDCCKPAHDVEFRVVPAADGDDAPQQVSIHIAFRPATLVSEGPVSLMSCPILFAGGGRAAHGTYPIEMKALTENYTCTLVDDPDAGPRRFTLRPGKTTVITW